MLKTIFKKIELILRWLILIAVAVFLSEELIRVIWYIVGQWGILRAIIDGAVYYKIGEFMILLPFIYFVHWNGVRTSDSQEKYVSKVRWLIWAGGVLSLISVLDLINRVIWVWWVILLVIMAAFLPFLMKRWAFKKAKWKGRILATFLAIIFAIHYIISSLTTGYCIAPLPASHPSPATTADGRWRQDLHYLATELPRLHISAFHTIDKREFEAEVAKIDLQIPDMSTDEIKISLMRLVAKIGDGHTQFGFPGTPSLYKLPLELYWLDSSLYVTGIDNKFHQFAGSRVQRIDTTSIEQAFGEVCELIPHESDGLWLNRSAELLTALDILRGLNIINIKDSVRFVFETEGKDTVSCYLKPYRALKDYSLYRIPAEKPFYKKRENEEFWSEYFKDINTAYLKYNSFTNPIAFPRFSDDFWHTVEDSSVEYLIIDFRDNSGGLSSCFDGFFEQILKHDKINQLHHLYLLVNRKTFSSASMYTAIIRRESNALIAGESMGGGINHYGDVRSFRLPNCGTSISYSVKYFELWPDSLPPFKIDIPIKSSSDDYFNAQDPVLDSVFQLIRKDLEKM